MHYRFQKFLSPQALLFALTVLVYATPSSALLGVRRRTAAVAYSAGAASASASQQTQAAQSAEASAEAASQSAAASAAAASEAAAASQAAAQPAAAPKTTQQKLEEVKSLYDQGLISESEYNTAKTNILAGASQ